MRNIDPNPTIHTTSPQKQRMKASPSPALSLPSRLDPLAANFGSSKPLQRPHASEFDRKDISLPIHPLYYRTEMSHIL
jgi:hypothetical protein